MKELFLRKRTKSSKKSKEPKIVADIRLRMKTKAEEIKSKNRDNLQLQSTPDTGHVKRILQEHAEEEPKSQKLEDILSRSTNDEQFSEENEESKEEWIPSEVDTLSQHSISTGSGHKSNPELEAYRLIPWPIGVVHFLQSNPTGHDFLRISQLKGYSGERNNEERTKIQAVLVCRICGEKSSYYCVQCTFLHEFPKVFACHQLDHVSKSACALEHQQHSTKHLKRYSSENKRKGKK